MKNPINELEIINKKTKKPLENISDFSLKEERLYFKNEERDLWKAKSNFDEAYFPFLDLYVIKNNGDIHPVIALADNGIAIRYGSFPIFHKNLDEFKELLIINKYNKHPNESDFLNMGIIESLYGDKISNIKLKRGMNPIKKDFENIYNKKYTKSETVSNTEFLSSVVRMITYYHNLDMNKGTRTSILRLLNSFKFDLLSFELRRSMDKMMGVVSMKLSGEQRKQITIGVLEEIEANFAGVDGIKFAKAMQNTRFIELNSNNLKDIEIKEE